MISLFVLAAQPLISLDLGVVDSGRVVEQLGKASGLKMRAVGGAEQSFLFVRVQGEPLDDVKAALAMAAGGKWEEKDKLWTLRGNLTMTQAYQALLKQRLADWMRDNPVPDPLTAEGAKSFEELRRESRNANQPAQARKAYDAMTRATPGWRLLRRLLERLGPGAADGMRIGERRLFALSPPAGVRPLPAGAQQDFRTLVAEMKLLKAALPTPPSQPFPGARNGLYFDQVDESTFAGLAFIITRDQTSLKLDVALWDKNGDYLMTQRVDVLGPEFTEGRERDPVPPEFPLALDSPLPAVRPETAARRKTLTDALAWGRGEIRGRAMPQAGRLLLQDMDRIDPLTILAAPSLDQLQRAMGRSLIASVPDTWFRGRLGRDIPDPRTVGEALTHLQRSTFGPLTLQVEREGRIQVLAPRELAQDRAARFERPPLAGLLRDLARGEAMLDARVRFASQTEHHRTLGLEGAFIRMATGVPMWPTFGDEYLAFSIFGGLSDQEKKAALGPEGLTLRTPSGRPKEALNLKRLFHSGTRAVMREYSPARRDSRGFNWSEIRYNPDVNPWDSFKPWIISRTESDPLLAYPEGIPSGTKIVVRVWSREGWLGFVETGPQAQGPSLFSVDRLARSVMREESMPGDESKFVPDLLYQGKDILLGITFRLPGGRRLDSRVEVQEIPRSGQMVPMAQLPKTMRDRIEARIAELRKQPSSSTPPTRSSPPE